MSGVLVVVSYGLGTLPAAVATRGSSGASTCASCKAPATASRSIWCTPIPRRMPSAG